jgi:mannosyltransferase OCH1-like enzyme
MKKPNIPKTIHYCWLSGEKMPKEIIKCINSWEKIMPEYKLVLWDMNKFDVNSHPFVKEACQVKKWAFASDYIRLYALYTDGGMYFDTDVFVKKSFDTFLNNKFFTGVEYHSGFIKKGRHLLNDDGTLKDGVEFFTHGIQIQAAIMGSTVGHPFLKSCMEWYDDQHFILEDGTYFDKLISPYIYAHIAAKYGFRYKNELQRLGYGITVYPNTVFAGNRSQVVSESHAVHLCKGEWRSLWEKTVLWLRLNNFLRWLLGKNIIKKIF